MGFSKRIFFENSREPTKEYRIVGITGTGRGTGVTHLNVLAANYMTSVLQRRTAMIERSDYNAWETIKGICQADSAEQTDSADYKYKIFGVTHYMQGAPRALASCLDGTYGGVIIDFGKLRPSIRAEWLRCEVKIVMTVLSEWKLETFLELLSEEEGHRTEWIYTAAFDSEDTREQVERQSGISLARAPLSVDAFSVDYETMRWFEGILQRRKKQEETAHKSMSRKQLLGATARLSCGNREGLISMIRNVEYGDRKKHQRIYLDGLKRYENRGARTTIDEIRCPEKEWERIFEIGEDGGFYMGGYVGTGQGYLKETRFDKACLNNPPKEKEDEDS